MKRIPNIHKYIGFIVGATVGIAYSGLAATADIAGQNGWTQQGPLYPQYGGGTPTTINVTTEQHASGNASLVFDVADWAGFSVANALFPSTISGGTVTVSTKIFFPSTSQGSFLFGFDASGGTNYTQISTYVGGPTDGGGYAEGGTGGYTLVRDQWKTLKLVVDLDHPGVTGNGTFYYDDMVTPAGTFTYGGGSIDELWVIVGRGFVGADAVTGPFYFDDMVAQQASTTVWSDNFDSYISSGAPTLTITNITGSVGGNYTITGTASANATVGVWTSTSVAPPLTSWTQVLSAGSQTGTLFNFTVPASGPQSFFRLKTIP